MTSSPDIQQRSRAMHEVIARRPQRSWAMHDIIAGHPTTIAGDA
jgi:hypothetical protein